ncbi:hypothetical protein [Algibacter sp. 2305UL17-15]|uniref:hypothetical protein n=1 Tax=Algibacter sp. 2305UL17-15 TaxID=3231268 RepID=UPI003459D90F
MKKIYLMMLTVFLNMALFSCSPQTVAEDNNAPQACCGEEDHIPPPPPEDGEDGG